MKLISICDRNSHKALYKTEQAFKSENGYILVNNPVRIFFNHPDGTPVNKNFSTGESYTTNSMPMIAYFYDTVIDVSDENVVMIWDELKKQAKDKIGITLNDVDFNWISWDVDIHTDLIGHCS